MFKEFVGRELDTVTESGNFTLMDVLQVDLHSHFHASGDSSGLMLRLGQFRIRDGSLLQCPITATAI